MRLVKLFVVAISCCLIGATPQNFEAQCFNSQPGDSHRFGSSLAMDGNYLVVGDPGANKVIIFTKDNEGRWYRAKEIKNTTGVVPEHIDDDFGDNIAIHKNILAIKTVYEEPDEKSKIFNLFTRKKTTYSPFGKYIENIYIIDLDKESSSKFVGSYKQVTSANERFIINDQGIIFIDTYKTKRIFNDFEFKKVPVSKLIILKRNKDGGYSESKIILSNKTSRLSHIISNNNLLMANSFILKKENSVYLFDLFDLHKAPKSISIDNSYIIDIATSNEFVAFKLLPTNDPSEYDFGNLIIQNLESGLRKTVSIKKTNEDFILYDNFLLEINPSERERFTEFYLRELSLYTIDNDINIKLIQQEKNITNALLKDRVLSTVKLADNTLDSLKICIRKVRQ